MLKDDVGYNISPVDWDQYPTIGRDGTYITDKRAMVDFLGDISGKSSMNISSTQASAIEKGMGLNPGSLQNGFKVRQVTGITDMMPRSPLAGNDYFLGAGQHLPSGAPEMVINSIPTAGNATTATILTVMVGP